MKYGKEDLLSSLFRFPDGIGIQAVDSAETQVIAHIACIYPMAICPLCQQVSERIHSSYERTVADVPCGGRRVILALTVRKFVCGTPTCQRKIFTERLSSLVLSHARVTNRLREALQVLGFATCGEGGARLVPKLGMHTSPPTLLRRMRDISIPPPETVRILGVDDWAWRKGQTYGTILVDLEAHCPIELLPDRTAETLETWLRAHPEVRVVSRDRGGEYAAAAKRGAPQAIQVADRFHLLKNVREGLKELMVRIHTSLPEGEEKVSDAVPAKARGMKNACAQPGEREEENTETASGKHYRTIPPHPYERPPKIRHADLHKQMRRDKRTACYENVRTLFHQGLSISAIAQTLDVCRETVRRFLRANEYPEMQHLKRGEKRSILDPYKPYILQRWQQGCRNSVQIYDEIKALGFKGSGPLLRMFLADLRKKHQEAGSAEVLTLNDPGTTITVPDTLPPKPLIRSHLSPTRASWLCISQPSVLDEDQKRQVKAICEGHPDLARAYHLSTSFVMMLAERRDNDVDNWLTQAEQSGIPEFKRLVNGMRRDYAAVKAAFSSEISNGQVEGQVHRLKLQKRQVYGRANFDLLRLRVLYRI